MCIGSIEKLCANVWGSPSCATQIDFSGLSELRHIVCVAIMSSMIFQRGLAQHKASGLSRAAHRPTSTVVSRACGPASMPFVSGNAYNGTILGIGLSRSRRSAVQRTPSRRAAAQVACQSSPEKKIVAITGTTKRSD